MFNLCLYNKCRVFLDSSSWDEFEKRKKEPLAHLWFYTEPSVISQQCLKTSEKIFPTLTSFDVSIIFSFLHGVSKGWQEYTAVKVILYGSLCRKVCWSAEVHGNHDRAQGWASVFNAFFGIAVLRYHTTCLGSPTFRANFDLLSSSVSTGNLLLSYRYKIVITNCVSAVLMLYKYTLVNYDTLGLTIDELF